MRYDLVRLAIGGLLVECSFACASRPTLNPTPLRLLSERANQVVLVAEAETTSSDQECGPLQAQFGILARVGTRDALSRAGFRVVTDTSAEHDLTARPTLTFQRCAPMGGFFGIGTHPELVTASFSVALEPGGTGLGDCSWGDGRTLTGLDIQSCASEAIAQALSGPEKAAAHSTPESGDYNVEWLASQNKRGLCGDVSNAVQIAQKFRGFKPSVAAEDKTAKPSEGSTSLEKTSADRNDSLASDLLKQIAGHQSTDDPRALWARWAVELLTLSLRCNKDVPTDALMRVARLTKASFDENLISAATKRKNCRVLVSVERLQVWPFEEQLVGQLDGGQFSNAEITRRLWLETLKVTKEKCDSTLTERERISLESRQDWLQRWVSLDDQILISLRSKLWTAIRQGKDQDAAQLAKSVSDREDQLDSRTASEKDREQKRQAAEKAAELEARRRANEIQTLATEPSRPSEGKSDGLGIGSLFRAAAQGFGDGLGRAVACKSRVGTCYNY